MKASDIIRNKRLEKLYSKYPEHKGWINNKLVELLSNQRVHSCMVYSQCFFKSWNEYLPITDSNGVVDLDELQEILHLEGFSANIFDEGETGIVTLNIRLK